MGTKRLPDFFNFSFKSWLKDQFSWPDKGPGLGNIFQFNFLLSDRMYHPSKHLWGIWSSERVRSSVCRVGDCCRYGSRTPPCQMPIHICICTRFCGGVPEINLIRPYAAAIQMVLTLIPVVAESFSYFRGREGLDNILSPLCKTPVACRWIVKEGQQRRLQSNRWSH